MARWKALGLKSLNKKIQLDPSVNKGSRGLQTRLQKPQLFQAYLSVKSRLEVLRGPPARQPELVQGSTTPHSKDLDKLGTLNTKSSLYLHAKGLSGDKKRLTREQK